MRYIDEIIDLIEVSIDDSASASLSEGKIIKWEYNSEVDRYRNLLDKWHEWVSNYQLEIANKLKIRNLRIKYTSHLWYFIEVWKNIELQESDWFFHKQTLTNAYRYTSLKLQEFETDIQKAQESLNKLEYNLFVEIRCKLAKKYQYIYGISRVVSELDFLSNWAFISRKYWYCKPELKNEDSLEIEWWKHPVISENQKDFVPNDAFFNKKEKVHIITWPNMWWKSTFLRQNALLLLLAHVWYDVPARVMKTWIVDKIFSRVWSGDNLYLWQSTFMVEMQEMSFILRSATSKSFIIIDEIWRGTSTLDGMSLAWAILKNIHDNIGAKCIFATHYHELIDHSTSLIWAKNFSVAVGENSESIVFLRKIVPWGIKKSYGIEVAKIAWINKSIIQVAKNMLLELEDNKISWVQLQIDPISEYKNENSEFIDFFHQINKLDINSITPLEALEKLNKIKQSIKKLK